MIFRSASCGLTDILIASPTFAGEAVILNAVGFRQALYIDIASFIGPTRMGDPKDVIYVLTAGIGGADAILTGDLRDFIESHYGDARVLSVRQFLDLHP